MKYQKNLLERLEGQSGQIGRLETTVGALPGLIENLKSANAPAPVVSALSAVAANASSKIAELRTSNSASTSDAAHIVSWVGYTRGSIGLTAKKSRSA
jgi:hypothetical protein